MKVKVQKIDGKASGDIELSDAVFGVEPRADILHRVVTWQLENRRATARPTRERSDVARTGKKFGNQKGGGTARHGDRKAPIFIGGGKAHGARKRDFNQSLNKKVRAMGLKMALSTKAKDGLVIVDSLALKDAKTQALKGHFDKHGFAGKVLVIDGEAVDAGFKQAANNLKGVNVMPAAGANVYDILNHDTLVLTKDAVAKLEARFNG
jgi:large subunit ribosomal protein L4